MSNKLYVGKLLRGDCILVSIRIEAVDLDEAWAKLQTYLKDKENIYDDCYILPEKA
ncbi:MAG TPA: hypothetical protein VMW50_13970 [Dehalococcoidia bacterium]|nr:hypothetical protein [Dehalococcoidia bacterium]